MTFIAFEGGEGVGKTTQINLLKERLPGMFPGRSFDFTREPGGTEFAEAVRSIILDKHLSEGASGKALFGLFAAGRFDHVARRIRGKLADGKVVITDRFFGSSFAYQVCAQDDPISEEFFDAHVREVGLFPAVTIVLDMDPEKSQERVGRRVTDVATHFDTRPIDFHKKLRDGYDRYVRKYGSRGVYKVNADQEPEQVFKQIMRVLVPAIDRP